MRLCRKPTLGMAAGIVYWQAPPAGHRRTLCGLTVLLIFKDVTLQFQNSFLSVPMKIRDLSKP